MDNGRQASAPHIFAVNTSTAFLAILQEPFADEGYRVTTAIFTPTTFDLIAAQQPDALIIDLVMGLELDWHLLAQVHADPASTAVPVRVTSTSEQVLALVREQAERYGTPCALAKPVDLAALLAPCRP